MIVNGFTDAVNAVSHSGTIRVMTSDEAFDLISAACRDGSAEREYSIGPRDQRTTVIVNPDHSIEITEEAL